VQRFNYDLVVLGAGSGGYAAARTARDLGASVALVDHGPLGGLCILRGCMPSKALLASSDAMHHARAAGALGVRIEGAIVPDMPFIARRKRALIKEFADYRVEGIETFPLYMGHAHFLNPHEIAVGDGTILEAKHVIVATGSVVSPPVIPGLADAGFLDSDAVLELESIPSSVIVLGGGYTAVELGQFLFRMGARTTMLVRGPQLLTASDSDVGGALTAYYREDGIDVQTGALVQEVLVRDGRKVVRYTQNGEMREAAADEIFYAQGRVPNVEHLQLASAGVTFDARQGVGVDLRMRTNVPHVYAIGDVTGEYLLVHVAIYQGEIAARNAILGTDEEADYRIVTAHTVFSDPQIGHVGMTEKDLQAAEIPYVMGRYDFAEHGKAMCLNETRGFVKLMASRESGEILGASIIGAQASELIHEVIVAMHYHATVEGFMRIPHLHPTLAEIWTYPAEECAAKRGRKEPQDQMVEVATSAH
jgi:pyruvate/2-oxoglutarate dehydrogenase complex dihydrolipoamide dehydrogenase (E3) component